MIFSFGGANDSGAIEAFKCCTASIPPKLGELDHSERLFAPFRARFAPIRARHKVELEKDRLSTALWQLSQ